MAQRNTKKRKKNQDKQDWEELCNYIRLNVMGYSKEMLLSEDFTKKLEKMSDVCDGFEPNEEAKDKSIRNYYYNVVLNTYRFCSQDIQWALKNKTFKNDKNKFNYICKIVEGNLSTVYAKTKRAEVNNEQSMSIDMSVHRHKGAEFKPTKKRIVSSRLKDLWNEVL